MRRLLLLALLAAVPLLIAACGGSSASGSGSEPGTVAAGRATHPPWPIQASTVKQRLDELGLPHPGKEKFHIHALLHIYRDGLLIPVPENIGIDEAHRVEAGLHTHDTTGVIHLEADKPFKATLGDFFRLWGVKLAANQIGALRSHGDEQLRAYVNGRPLDDPAAHVLGKDDNIVLAYGKKGTFPIEPSTFPLKVANGEAKGQSSCKTKGGETQGNGCSIEQK